MSSSEACQAWVHQSNQRVLRVSWTKWLVLLMMPKEHFKVSSVTPQHVNHINPSFYIYSQRVWLCSFLLLWCVSYIAECFCVCVFWACVHMIVSLLMYLDSVCSCGTIYHVSWLPGWGNTTHKSPSLPAGCSSGLTVQISRIYGV